MTGFAEAYDARRSARAQNLLAAERVSSDALPTCPRCLDLLAPGARFCVECGCAVTVDKPVDTVE